MKLNTRNIVVIAMTALFAAVVIPLSCKKSFLTQTNTNLSTVDNSFQTSANVVALINSIYDTYQNSDLLKKSIWYTANFQTHDWFNFGGDVVWNNYSITADFGALSTFWNGAYVGINRANSALDSIVAYSMEKGVVAPALGNRLLGEAYFLRGMTYYYLASTFGGVPLELKDTTNGLTPRTTQDSVFMQVVSDMQKAENLLVSKTALLPADLGRATKGAAMAYLGKTYLFNKMYTEAAAQFKAVMDLGVYQLTTDYADNFKEATRNNIESS